MTVQTLLDGECAHASCRGACPRALRTQLAEMLRSRGWDGQGLENAVLAMSELASNAQDHAKGPYQVRVSCDEVQCEIVISDFGPSGRAWQGRDRGRGLMLLEAISQETGSRRSAAGSEHWCLIELEAPSMPPAP